MDGGDIKIDAVDAVAKAIWRLVFLWLGSSCCFSGDGPHFFYGHYYYLVTTYYLLLIYSQPTRFQAPACFIFIFILFYFSLSASVALTLVSKLQ